MGGWRLKFGLQKFLGAKSQPNGQTIIADAPPTVPIRTRAASSAPETIWTSEVSIAGRQILPPDPRMMKAIGLNHSFESAVADIVDNSIDAGAKKLLIRFIRDKHRLIGLCIVDDGKGMDEETINRAMTVGGDRTYQQGDLGHFGVGLKAASLGQARILTVVSRAMGCSAVGRRWLMESAASGFECDILTEEFAGNLLNRNWEYLKPSIGTVVMWTEVKSFASMADGASIDRFVDRYLTGLRHHLGLIFHRLIAKGKIEIAVDVEDIGLGEVGIRFQVEAIDPFGYVKSGRRDHPRVLKSTWRGQPVDFKCHVWPGRSNHANFRLFGGRPEHYQGFFIYRSDRLLQHGGWNDVVLAERDLQLARVELDISAAEAGLFSMNAEKTRVETSPEFGAVVKSASNGPATFLTFIDDSKTTYRDSQKRKRERPKVVRPGKGFSEVVRSAIDEEFEFAPGDALDIRWVDLGDDTFFEIDRDASLIRLNKRYRSAVIGQRDARLNDAPLVKALIYLLAEETFHGAFLGSKTRDNLAIWQAILTAAAQAEMK
jgi:Histidine kinase-, DNA gyrase B-, and HSP90-like ATPase